MAGNTARFITPAQLVKELPHHDTARASKELGPSYNYMSSSLIPEADVHISARYIKQVPVDFKSFVEPHKHQANQVYIIIDALAVEVILNGERHEVSGPAGIFIPAGMTHTIRPLKGSGYIVAVTEVGKYE